MHRYSIKMLAIITKLIYFSLYVRLLFNSRIQSNVKNKGCIDSLLLLGGENKTKICYNKMFHTSYVMQNQNKQNKIKNLTSFGEFCKLVVMNTPNSISIRL